MLGRQHAAGQPGRHMLCSFSAASLEAVVVLVSLALVHSAREFRVIVSSLSKEQQISEAQPSLAKAASTAPKPVHNNAVTMM